MHEDHGKYFSFGRHSYTDYHGDMNDPTGLIEYPNSSFHPRFLSARKSGLERGIDPKEKWMAYCKPSCTKEEAMVKRCEEALKLLKVGDKSCIYRYREWVECVENCVQPKIFYHLSGASRKGPIDWLKGHGLTGLH
ncbi:unnamed protein product [Blepharisma stoltei]|uniref:Ubiquinol-cytochrome C reductase hinge domain-containing protein n=1 Tax=Blepharisma stoltei TaxID=1481888 RepID=A0AAU9K946_9CILI|nr:unnamed protein product [Blepharisma stoltei]